MTSYGPSLVILGLLMGVLATYLGPTGMGLLLWMATSFTVVGTAYLFQLRGVFGKRPDGSLAASHVLILVPFLGLTWSVWHLARVLSSEPAIDVLSPQLRLARRLLNRELPTDVRLVIDLTAEFPTRSPAPNYQSLRILDGGQPDPVELRQVLDRIPRDGVTLVHCAQGHGRTALFAACLLIDRDGLDAAIAVAQVLAVRPHARMSRTPGIASVTEDPDWRTRQAGMSAQRRCATRAPREVV